MALGGIMFEGVPVKDSAVTDIACAALHDLKIGNTTPTTHHALVGREQAKLEQNNILAQAQWHIAIQKIALQAGGLKILEGQDTCNVRPCNQWYKIFKWISDEASFDDDWNFR